MNRKPVIKNLSFYKKYVCPYCFNQLNKCKCCFEPHSLIMIDVNVQEAIRELNTKQYGTSGSCEGHFNGVCSHMYIAFVKEYNFSTVPNGFIYVKNRYALLYKYKSKNEDDFEKEKIQAKENLIAWTRNLTKYKEN